MIKEIDQTRMDVWTRAWVAVANANDCREHATATSWANKCLAAFDETFRKEITDARNHR